MNTVVKKWFNDKEYGFLDNGGGPDILVRKADLIKCQYLKPGTVVEFECHNDKKGLIARKVSISRQGDKNKSHNNMNRNKKTPYIGVMT